MLKIGILGLGAIGSTIARALDHKQVDAELVALADRDCARAEALSAELADRPAVVFIDEMIARSDLAVEAESQAALGEFVPQALARERDMLIMSVGGLLGHEEWFREARENGCRIYIPSGAIAGLDGIKSASMGRVDSALLTSHKPVAALRGSKYAVEGTFSIFTVSRPNSPLRRISWTFSFPSGTAMIRTRTGTELSRDRRPSAARPPHSRSPGTRAPLPQRVPRK